MSDTYLQLLAKKEKRHVPAGFVCNSRWDWLYPFQQFCVRRALLEGRFALFEDCGLGKSRQQLTWAMEVVKYTNRPVIIFAPLAVVNQTINEANIIGITCYEYDGQLDTGIYITNYEQIDNIPSGIYAGVVLDESSIIKSFDGVYKTKLIELFANTPYKLCCTATPSPNDPMELGSHAEFLNVMASNVMLAMFFVHDSGKTQEWRLKGHAVKKFWRFVSSWAIMLSKPSDIGFSNEGYGLPCLEYHETLITTAKKDNGKLFNDNAVSATNHNAELRITEKERLGAVVKIVNSKPNESFIIWVKQNDEGAALCKLLPEAVEVKGSDSPEWKREKLLGFAQNKFRLLVTKIKIGGFGMNFQNCHNMIFAAPDFSFEGLYQAVRREWRFGQKETVHAYLITTDTMENIMVSLNTKNKKFAEMQSQMQSAMNEVFISQEKTKRENITITTKNAIMKLGDSLQLVDELEEESIGFSMFSPPFPELYVYSSEIEDLGNVETYDEFNEFFQFVPQKLMRVMESGRNVCIHCMDTPIQKGKEGYIGLRDWSGMIVKQMIDAGFIYHTRVTIWKDPVTEMQRTKKLGLLHKQIKKDSAMSVVGAPDYLLVFRKPGINKKPITHQDTNPNAPDYLPVDLWQKYASPVWMDINQSRTLNGRNARDGKDEKHICPLQIDTIERATHLWSNEDDKCLTMFGGIGSETATWVRMNRQAVAFELKTSYFNQHVKNVKDAETELATPTINFKLSDIPGM